MRAYAMSRVRVLVERGCSHEVSGSVRWGMLCDCPVLTEHPRYIEDYGTEQEIDHDE